MATEKVWEFIPSYVLGNANTQTSLAIRNMWFLKAGLTGEIAGKDQASAAVAIGAMAGKWAMYYSCNGVTAGTAGDGVDRLRSGGSGVCTEADFVYGLAGAAHSWYVLYSSLLGLYLLVSYEGATNLGMRIAISPNAFTGGTTTARPTATNESSGATGASNTTADFSVTTANVGASKAHLGLAADGAFWFLQSKDGSGFFSVGIICGKTTDRQTGDTPYNCFLLHDGAKTATGVFTSTVQDAWYGRSHNGAAMTNTIGVGPYNASAVYALVAIDTLSNKYSDWPLYLHTTGAAAARRGRMVDIKFAATPLLDNDCDPLTGQIQFLVCGILWMPTCEALSL